MEIFFRPASKQASRGQQQSLCLKCVNCCNWKCQTAKFVVLIIIINHVIGYDVKSCYFRLEDWLRAKYSAKSSHRIGWKKAGIIKHFSGFRTLQPHFTNWILKGEVGGSVSSGFRRWLVLVVGWWCVTSGAFNPDLIGSQVWADSKRVLSALCVVIRLPPPSSPTPHPTPCICSQISHISSATRRVKVV